MHREYGKWWSNHLQREMEYLWFGHAGPALLIFPTSGGRFFENEDFGLVGALGDKLDGGQLQLFCVDSIDTESWTNYSIHPADRVRRHEQFDQYLRAEVVPYMTGRSGQGRIIVYGASFGAYHAANFAARHPEAVSRAICFSGLYDIHRFVEGYWDDLCYFNCPTAYIANMDGEWVNRLSSVGWVVATGEHDSLVAGNRSFAGLLHAKGIPVHAEFWEGAFGHDWPWWQENLRRFV